MTTYVMQSSHLIVFCAYPLLTKVFTKLSVCYTRSKWRHDNLRKAISYPKKTLINTIFTGRLIQNYLFDLERLS